ncbi:MAG: tetratricopeptide repeat protein, partial [Thermoplasmatales archaeon]|nr:tetratricopeptide repeat protein [Thermoplasmatales archaeon]
MFIDRNQEIAELKSYLDDMIKGNGKTVFINGEAGIGKTRLINELQNYALSKNVRCLSAECVPQGSKPYMAFINAFQDAAEPIIPMKEEFATVEEVFLINRAGMVMAHESKTERGIDSDIVGGMLTAVQDFVKDSFADKASVSGLARLDYGDRKILIEQGRTVFMAAVISGQESDEIRNDMKNMVGIIEKDYADVVEKWKGDISKLTSIKNVIETLPAKKYSVERKLDSSEMESEKIKLFEGGLQSVLKISEEQPLLLFLDNLHWVDMSSLQLLHYLSRNTRNAKIMICGAYRREELVKEHPLIKIIEMMKAEKLFVDMELDRFHVENVPDFIYSLLGKNAFPDEFISKIGMETGGNPFFIEELLKTLIEEGVIYKEGKKWYAKDVAEIETPKTIKDVVFRHLGHLDEECKEVLKYAATIGKDFDFSVLQKTMNKNEEELANLLEEVIEVGIFKENETLHFTHPMTQEVLYRELPNFKKTVLHKKAGFALEALYPKNAEENSAMLAYHFSKGGVPDKTILYATKAGDRARKMFSFDEAKRYYKLALDGIEKLEENMENKKVSLLNKLGEAYFVLGEWNSALECAKSSIKLSKETGDEKQTAESFRNIGQINENRSEWDDALENYERSLQITERIKDNYGIAESHKGLGWIHWRKGEYDEAIEHYSKTVEYAGRIGLIPIAASAYISLGSVYGKKGKFDIAAKYINKSLRMLEKMGNSFELTKAYNSLGAIHYELGEWDKALECFGKCAEISKKIGDIRGEAYGLSNAGEMYAKKHDFKKAIECSDKALEIFKKLDEKYMISKTYQHYGIIYRMKKDWEKSKIYFDLSAKILEELDIPYDLAETYLEFGIMYREKGDNERAKEYLRKAADIYRKIGAV